MLVDMLRRVILTLVLAAGCCSTPSVQAQEAERPPIALVLSGGAAKGMAHVGAIQVFEEEGIPIDIVAGTSAGALIGSFYAVGYNGKQIEEIIRSAGDDLNDLFFDRIDAKLLRIEETRILRQSLITLPMRGGKPTLPERIVSPLGPIRLTVAKAEENPVRLGIEIGHSF